MGDIIAVYKDRHYQVADTDPREVLRLLMEQNNFQQKDLATELGSRFVVSEILGGKRAINVRQAKVLAALTTHPLNHAVDPRVVQLLLGHA